VRRLDEIYLSRTLPDPFADPEAPWYERRRPIGWPPPHDAQAVRRWVMRLLPGGISGRRNPPGTLERQASRLLDLLG